MYDYLSSVAGPYKSHGNLGKFLTFSFIKSQLIEQKLQNIIYKDVFQHFHRNRDKFQNSGAEIFSRFP